MITCAVCGTPLIMPLEQFGPADAPLCMMHFLNQPDWLRKRAGELENRAKSLKSDVDLLKAEIAALESNSYRAQVETGCIPVDIQSELSDRKRELALIEDQYREAQSSYEFAKQHLDARPDKEKARLDMWTEGRPLLALR